MLRASGSKMLLLSRILGRLRPLAFSHIHSYAPFSKRTNPHQGCDPYDSEILRNKLLKKNPPIGSESHKSDFQLASELHYRYCQLALIYFYFRFLP